MLFKENFFLFREKYHISGKCFGISLNNIKFLDALFFRKVPLKAWPPQLLEASYAPGLTLYYDNSLNHSLFINIILTSLLVIKCLQLPTLRT
jgi:hypothetical protein